jgi:hypothetical protein
MYHHVKTLIRPPKISAQQLRHSAIVALMSNSLAEEENADQLLNQIARTLMSVAKIPRLSNRAPRKKYSSKPWAAFRGALFSLFFGVRMFV